jgi:hypothetical protein
VCGLLEKRSLIASSGLLVTALRCKLYHLDYIDEKDILKFQETGWAGPLLNMNNWAIIYYLMALKKFEIKEIRMTFGTDLI